MAQDGNTRIKALVCGVVSIASYIALFMNQEFIVEYYPRGDFYAALPVATALYFSFIHGAFASNVIELLGLRAATDKSEEEKTEEPGA